MKLSAKLALTIGIASLIGNIQPTFAQIPVDAKFEEKGKICQNAGKIVTGIQQIYPYVITQSQCLNISSPEARKKEIIQIRGQGGKVYILNSVTGKRVVLENGSFLSVPYDSIIQAEI